ncbi:prepilin-type N-terminal cleavage/methylation domain-containing protein [Salicola sp. Rm-C-2C1-2]|uniref:type IV pilus modification PilV family protein n=1 Tax=Salicola sp. Rm-C-2C1-2 TaxID=3141321 RepID=UPI0032E463C3
MTSYSNGASRSQGFSIVEVIVTVLVLSIGLLGMAAMQTQAMKQTTDMNRYSIATLHANTVAEEYRLSGGSDWSETLKPIRAAVQRDLGDDATISLESEDELQRITVSWNAGKSNDKQQKQTVTVYARNEP